MEPLRQALSDQGISPFWTHVLLSLAKGILVLLVAWLTDLVAKRILLRIVTRVIKNTKTTFDDELIEHRVLDRLAHLVPILIVFVGTPWIFGYFPEALNIAQTVVMIATTILTVAILNGVLNAILDIYKSFSVSRKLPLNAVIQILKFLLVVCAIIAIVSQLMGRSPLVLFSGLGALSAITMLVFRDPIMGIASGIQLTANNMVEVGDWIEVPSDGVDGDVLEVNMTTVVVQNWDKTISTVPAYKLMNGHFRNWRGMSRSGGRRIKRTLMVDISTVRFCDQEMLDRFKKVEFIKEYVESKIVEVETYNKDRKVDETVLINGRRLTNVGTFRAYLKAYLYNHPKIHKEMTFLVRYLEPESKGIPIQIYVFSKDQDWVAYEGIQADIIDHLIAAADLFDLSIYQEPSSKDMRAVAESLSLQRN